MPITVTAPRGVLTAEGERRILPRLTAELIDVSGLTGNSFFEPIVGGTVHVLDPEDIYAGGRPAPIVMVELKLPAPGLPTLESRTAFIERATAVVAELTIEEHDSNSTWINVLNAPDGAWGIGGRSWTNEALGAAIGEAAAAA
jgi:phenylpyruvate tautomerase PptA (4-oxalocrotonate tautomerase family)